MNGIDESDKMQYNNLVISNELLHCMSECEYEMYECLSCANESNHETKTRKYICFSCMKKCHDQTHKFEAWNVQNVRNKKCACVVCKK